MTTVYCLELQREHIGLRAASRAIQRRRADCSTNRKIREDPPCSPISVITFYKVRKLFISHIGRTVRVEQHA